MPAEITERVLDVIAASQRIPREKVTIDSKFEDLGIDSMDGVNILFGLEGEFDINIPDDQARNIRSVRDAVEGVRALLAAKAAAGQ